jgi:hypothetical protein
MSKSAIIPIRFTEEEKYALQQLATEANLPISVYVKTKVQPFIKPKLVHINKTTILIQKLKSLKVDPKVLDEAVAYGRDMRKNFNLNQTR